jgi:hypothetical protein
MKQWSAAGRTNASKWPKSCFSANQGAPDHRILRYDLVPYLQPAQSPGSKHPHYRNIPRVRISACVGKHNTNNAVPLRRHFPRARTPATSVQARLNAKLLDRVQNSLGAELGGRSGARLELPFADSD